MKKYISFLMAIIIMITFSVPSIAEENSFNTWWENAPKIPMERIDLSYFDYFKTNGTVETAYNNGGDYEARKNMLHAAYKAGLAFSKSYVGYIHAVAHSLGGQYNIPHGLANAVLMPIFLEAYGSVIHKKLYKLALYAGVATKNDSVEAGAKKFIEAIKELNRNMNVPEKLDGIKSEDISIMAKHADKEANPLYPVPILMNAKELEVFYRRFAGLEG